jgi:hypothetical protein
VERRHITLALWLLASLAMLLTALDPVTVLGFGMANYIVLYVLPLAAIGAASLYASGWWMVALRIVAGLIALWDLFLLAFLAGGTQGRPGAIGAVVMRIGVFILIAAYIALIWQPTRRPAAR